MSWFHLATAIKHPDEKQTKWRQGFVSAHNARLPSIVVGKSQGQSSKLIIISYPQSLVEIENIDWRYETHRCEIKMNKMMVWPLNHVEVGAVILKFWCKRAGRVKVTSDTEEKPLLTAGNWVLVPPKFTCANLGC